MVKSLSSGRQRAALILSTAISLLIVVFLFAKMNWAEVWKQLQLINPWYLIPLSAGFFLLFVFRAARWRLLLPRGESLSYGRIFDATIIGFFASTVLPLRAGEVIRPWALSRLQPVSFSASLASILIERLADSICLLGLLLICLTKMSNIPPFVMTGLKVIGLLCGAILFVVILSYLLPEKMERLFHRICDRTLGRISPRASRTLNVMISEYFIGVRVISSWWSLVQVILWTLAIWLTMGAWFQVMLWAFGEFPSWWVGLILNVIISLAVAAPSAPGFVGTFQLGCIVALANMHGYSKEFAMAYSVIAHVLQIVLMVIAGLVVLHLRGLSFSQIRNIEPRPTDQIN
jgi:uncharacterized protein (TIRG00374 family)